MHDLGRMELACIVRLVDVRGFDGVRPVDRAVLVCFVVGASGFRTGGLIIGTSVGAAAFTLSTA